VVEGQLPKLKVSSSGLVIRLEKFKKFFLCGVTHNNKFGPQKAIDIDIILI